MEMPKQLAGCAVTDAWRSVRLAVRKGADEMMGKRGIRLSGPGGGAEMDQAPESSSLLRRTGRWGYLLLKRCFDVAFALVLSVLLVLPLLVLALLIVIRDPGNPLYWQTRVGRNGKEFRMLKLRSMRKDAETLENVLTAEQLHAYRTEYKLEDDPRLIGYRKAGDGRRCFGGILRRCSLDELPQIVWNILVRGDMSFVGPRPVLQEELDKYYTEREQKLLLSVKPGLTGYWQAYARNDGYYATGERQKMELYYVRNRSLLFDIRILAATVGAVLWKSGA